MSHFYNRRTLANWLLDHNVPFELYDIAGVKSAKPNFRLPKNSEFRLVCQGSTWDEVARKLKAPFPGEVYGQPDNQPSA